MTYVGDILAWFGAVENWTGPDGLLRRVLEHMALSATIVVVSLALGLPIGVLFGHRLSRRIVALSMVTLLAPVVGILRLLETFSSAPSGAPTWIVVGVLGILGAPLVAAQLANGLAAVDRQSLLDARALGVTGRSTLRMIELPAARPMIVQSARAASSFAVSSAALAAGTGIGGLGRLIVDGVSAKNPGSSGAGAVLLVLVALIFDRLARAVSSAVVGRRYVHGTVTSSPQTTSSPK